MTEHPNAVRFRSIFAAMNAGDISLLVEYVADDIEWWETGCVEPIRGRAALETRMVELAAFQIDAQLHDLFANEEHLVALVHATAVRDGVSFSYSTAEVYHFDKNGRVIKRQAFAHDSKPILDFFG